jgi:superoxide dismutase, Fe-Mn family
MESSQIIIANFGLPYLPFKLDALEPYISKNTMELHYNMHHRGYVDKLNKAIDEKYLEDLSMEELLHHASDYDSEIRNNVGGHYNHTLLWRILSPEKMKPYGKLLSRIEVAFQSFDGFKEQFKEVAKSHFGSGWAWLVLNPKGILEIGCTPNQDNPLMDISELKGYPLFGLDLWEHAYYLDYQNRKGDYIDAFWNIIDWTEVSNRYEESLLLLS